MKTILLAEDDDNQRLMVKEELEEAGYRVEEARNGREALEKLKEIEPDLIVLDIRMPEMDGIEALGHIVEDRKDMPVILHTAYSNYKENFLSWSADDYVVKSSDLTALLEKINNRIGV
ncbi:MAG: response regulator [Fibrobacteria bacterium]|nr:response regulator [Fibrobacteria bacterium]